MTFTPRIVPVPGMPGESIDARVLPDVVALLGKFKLKLSDGYSTDSVHAADGDHPKGFGADLVPDTSRGGTWDDVDAAAKFAADHPGTFRWVGYDGRFGTSAAPNHGRGLHLHVSWHGDGTAGDAKPVNLFSNDKSWISKVGGAIVGGIPVVGPILDSPVVGGVAGDVAGKAGGAAADAAAAAGKATAGALVGLVTDAVGHSGARVALSIALVAGAVVLVGIGVGRMLGIGEKVKTLGTSAIAAVPGGAGVAGAVSNLT